MLLVLFEKKKKVIVKYIENLFYSFKSLYISALKILEHVFYFCFKCL